MKISFQFDGSLTEYATALAILRGENPENLAKLADMTATIDSSLERLKAARDAAAPTANP